MHSTDIFMTVDNNFLEYALVVIRWIKFHTSWKVRLYLCVPNTSTKYTYTKRLEDISNENFYIKIISFTGTEKRTKFFREFEKHNYHLSIASFFRLFIADFVPKEVEKIIYLDADLIINTDLHELYNIDIKKTIGGVDGLFGKKWTQKYLSEIDITITDYINSWVLLINLKRWRKLNLQREIIKYAEKNSKYLKLGDQDLINIFFQGEIEYIDARWNNIVWFGKALSKDTNCIFHTVWKIKANSIFYPNYEIKKLYNFFSETRTTIWTDLKIIFVYLFLSNITNTWKMLWNKRILKYEKNSLKDHILLFTLLLHPGVFYFFISKFYKKIKKIYSRII